MEMLLDGEVLDEPVADGFASEVQQSQAPETALQVLHYDLIQATSLEVLAEERPNRVLAIGDASLQFHACHGPARQVEVLRDVLLGLLDGDKTLQYRDIVVMTPDVTTYAPLVKAVLGDGHSSYHQAAGWGQSGGPKLPVYVADLGLRELNPLADGLLRVLEVIPLRKADGTPINGLLNPQVTGTTEIPRDGAGKVLDNGDRRPLDVKVGDRVLFGKYSGTEVKVSGQEVLVMREEDIMGVVE
jgi:co-chaperonin GroES (HSP10)